jgi:hypothetical protein
MLEAAKAKEKEKVQRTDGTTEDDQQQAMEEEEE